VALISSLAASKMWPGQNAIGRRFRVGDDEQPLITVTGIIGDVRGVALGQTPRMTVYRPYWQASRPSVSVAVRTAGDARAAGATLAATVRAIDPLLPVPAPQSMEDIVSASVAQPRFQMVLVLLFALAAAMLASLGIYGVVAYAVAQRTSELGVRTALGASPAAILLLVVRQGLVPVAIGLALGLAASFAVGRAVSSLLYDVAAFDPMTTAGVILAIGVVSMTAAVLTAWRAMRLDPVAALRQE
jgi:putative ABC transport system permease protein